MKYLIAVCTGTHFIENDTTVKERELGLMLSYLEDSYFDNISETERDFLILSSSAKHTKSAVNFLHHTINGNWTVEYPEVLNLVDTMPKDIQVLADLIKTKQTQFKIVVVVGQCEMLRYLIRKYEAVYAEDRIWPTLQENTAIVCSVIQTTGQIIPKVKINKP
jgi:hypothetical protein